MASTTGTATAIAKVRAAQVAGTYSHLVLVSDKEWIMGGRSRSSSRTQSTQGGMTNGVHKVSNGEVAGMQQDLKNSQMSDVFGGFGAMLQDAKGMFGQHPIMNLMGGMLGMPIQMETPDVMTDFINKYRKPEQSAYEQRIAELMQKNGTQPQPQQPFNVNQYMRNQFTGR